MGARPNLDLRGLKNLNGVGQLANRASNLRSAVTQRLDLPATAKGLQQNALGAVTKAIETRTGKPATEVVGDAKQLVTALRGGMPNGILQSLPAHLKEKAEEQGLPIAASPEMANQMQKLIEQARGQLETKAKGGAVDLPAVQKVLDKAQGVVPGLPKVGGLFG